MGKYVIILTSCLMVLLSGGCDSDGDKGSDLLGDIHYVYNLNLKIVDKSGNNLAEGIELDGLTPSDYPVVYLRSVPRVSKEAYSLTMFFDDHLVVNDLQLFMIKDSHGDKVLNMAYYKSAYGSYSSNWEVRLVSPHIFGDSVAHVIKSTWHKKGYNNMCSSVTFDGDRCDVELAKEEKNELIHGFVSYTYDVVIAVDGE